MPITPSDAANLLTKEWRAGILLAANEESVFMPNMMDASAGAVKLRNGLYVRKLGTMTAQSLSGSGLHSSLTYNTEAGSVVLLSPSTPYSAVELNVDTLMEIDSQPMLKAAYKEQLMASIGENMDSTTAQSLIPALTTSVEGGAVALSKALMLTCLKDLIVQAKDRFKPGKTRGHFIIHPNQSDALLDIPEITAANIRGDSQNPNVKGWVWDAWNCSVEESGNIHTAAGVAYNVLFLEDAFAKAWGTKPYFLDPQFEGLLVRLICVGQYGVGTIFDEYAVMMKTAS